MPGSGQWNMLTEIDDNCWFTDQWIYTLIFWDAKTIGKNALENQNKIQSGKLINEVEKVNPRFRLQCDDADSLVSHSSFFSDASEGSYEKQKMDRINVEALVEVDVDRS